MNEHFSFLSLFHYSFFICLLLFLLVMCCLESWIHFSENRLTFEAMLINFIRRLEGACPTNGLFIFSDPPSLNLAWDQHNRNSISRVASYQKGDEPWSPLYFVVYCSYLYDFCCGFLIALAIHLWCLWQHPLIMHIIWDHLEENLMQILFITRYYIVM